MDGALAGLAECGVDATGVSLMLLDGAGERCRMARLPSFITAAV